MCRYIKFEGIFIKKFENPKTKEYSTNVVVVYDATDSEFKNILSSQNNGVELTKDEFYKEIKTSEQYIFEMKKLQALFVEKAEVLKEMLADKSSVLPGYIDKQTEIYEYMYQFAKQGAYDDKTNKEIIRANEEAKKTAADFTLLLNETRKHIELIISEGKDIDEVYSKAKQIGRDTTKEQIADIVNT